MNSPDEVYVPDVIYRGDYDSFADAQACSQGYHESAILEKTRETMHRVLRGEFAYERDSVGVEKLDLNFPLLALLSRSAAQNSGRLSVLDFGGALGSTYCQCRKFLSGLPHLEWSIVEQPAHVACGQQEFSNRTLQFYNTIDDCLAVRQPNVLLLSGVLQCLPAPWAVLQNLARDNFQTIILDRTPIIEAERDRLTVETVSPRVYPASYPAWFFSRKSFESHIPPGWAIDVEFDAIDRQLLDGAEIVFKGFGIIRRQ